jgi:ABC-type Mn2+/Zn2+ transport system permease subunit
MDQVFWIPISLIVVGVLLGAWIGGTHRSSSARSGALIGLYLSAMFSFPLIAIGLANT